MDLKKLTDSNTSGFAKNYWNEQSYTSRVIILRSNDIRPTFASSDWDSLPSSVTSVLPEILERYKDSINLEVEETPKEGKTKDTVTLVDSVLEEGFTLKDLEDFIYANETEIRHNLDTYGFSSEDIKEMDNYYDVSSVLGCDSRVLKDYELSVVTDTIYSILFDNLSDNEDTSIVDLLWVLQSSGVAYDKRRSMGVSKEEYREYILDLIDKNKLSHLVHTSDAEASGAKWDNSMIDAFEEATNFDVLDYNAVQIEVLDRAGWDSEDRVIIETFDKNFDEVCKEALRVRVQDSSDPLVDWRSLVKNDLNKIKKDGWSQHDIDVYATDIQDLTTTPICFHSIEGATDKSGVLDKDSPFLTKFLKHNEDSLRAFSFLDKDEDADLLDLFLYAYTTELLNI